MPRSRKPTIDERSQLVRAAIEYIDHYQAQSSELSAYKLAYRGTGQDRMAAPAKPRRHRCHGSDRHQPGRRADGQRARRSGIRTQPAIDEEQLGSQAPALTPSASGRGQNSSSVSFQPRSYRCRLGRVESGRLNADSMRTIAARSDSTEPRIVRSLRRLPPQ